uniref:Ig-like domain-containing protein n=1 Tax=Syphacia muris TaxID=451379 RepID=A0A0N5AKJ2_9BILA
MGFTKVEKIAYVIFITAIFVADTHTSNRIFKLPRLIVQSDRLYLLRNEINRLYCKIEIGWPNVSFSSKVLWLKDGVPINELTRLKKQEIYQHDSVLSIRSGRSYVEGNYQCKAEIQGVQLPPSTKHKRVSVKLISAPLKLRKARITGFSDVGLTVVEVELGEIARIPCNGLPDVVPGPPAIRFQKQEEDVPSFNEQDYWVTSTGLQLFAREPSYAGTYFCIATNVFTNITRKSRSPIVRRKNLMDAVPKLVFPLEQSSLEHPIIVNINRGRSALLECIISNAQVSWKRYNSLDSSFGSITIGHDRDSKFLLRFSNLDINWTDEDDSGIYVCEGRPIVRYGTLTNDDLASIPIPQVFYKLHVRSPTNVHLKISQLNVDKTWQINCMGINFDYEVPSVYINGETLQDAMDKLGVPPSVGFFSNPVHVSLTPKTVISGSVQCMSHPAMDEAEIYGDGLERGRASNLYVDNSESMQVNLITEGPRNVTVMVSQTAELTCRVHVQATAWLWSKGNTSINILGDRVRTFNEKLKIGNVTLADSGWYTCEATDSGKRSNRASAYLKVIDPNNTVTVASTKSGKNNLNETGEEYKSQETSPTFINPNLVPFTLDIQRASVSGCSVQLYWSYPEHHPASENITAFKVELCTEYLQEWAETQELRSYVRHTTVDNLTPGRRYKFRVVAVLSGQPSVNSFPTEWVRIEQTEDGIMLPSEPRIERLSAVSDSVLKLKWKTDFTSSNNAPEKFLVTYGKSSSTHTNTVEVQGNETQITITSLEPSTEYRVTVSAENPAGLSPRSQPVYARTHAARGKFADTSHRIFNEQLVLKKRLHYHNNKFRQRYNEQQSPQLQSLYSNYQKSPSTSMQNLCLEMQVNPKVSRYDDNDDDDDKNYYNEEAFLIPGQRNKNSNDNNKKLAMSQNSNGVERSRTAVYGELMLCTEVPENDKKNATITKLLDSYSVPVTELDICDQNSVTD